VEWCEPYLRRTRGRLRQLVHRFCRSRQSPALYGTAEAVGFLVDHEAEMRQLVDECHRGLRSVDDLIPAVGEVLATLTLYGELSLVTFGRTRLRVESNARYREWLFAHLADQFRPVTGSTRPGSDREEEWPEPASDDPSRLADLLVIAPSAP
jgi:hypothetical protein